MKALTLTAPFATLIACGEKRIETRSWATSYRGLLAIHEAKTLRREDREYAEEHHAILAALGRHGYRDLRALPLGCVVAVARVVACESTDVACRGRFATPQELMFGDYEPGRYAWHLRDVARLPQPIPAKGALGLWDWRDDATERWLIETGWMPETGARR